MRGQHQPDRWHHDVHEHKLHATYSGIRQICHQRSTTSCTGLSRESFDHNRSVC